MTSWTPYSNQSGPGIDVIEGLTFDVNVKYKNRYVKITFLSGRVDEPYLSSIKLEQRKSV